MTNIIKLRKEIEMLEYLQKELKYQRKTKIPAEKRVIEHWRACMKHHWNRVELRHMYIVYGELRNKYIDIVEPNRKTEPDETELDKIRKKYQKKHQMEDNILKPCPVE